MKISGNHLISRISFPRGSLEVCSSVVVKIVESSVVLVDQVEMILEPGHLTRMPRFPQLSQTSDLMNKLSLLGYPQ